ncbi:MAG: transcription termination/antitermination protein NusA [Brevinemataceae bacterium]
MAFPDLITAFAKDQGISEDLAESILKETFTTLYKRENGKEYDNLKIEFNNNGISLWQIKTVVKPEDLQNDITEISINEVETLKDSNESITEGSQIHVPIPSNQFGRQAAQIMKQLLKQKVMDIQKDLIYNEFVDKKGTLFTGKIKSRTDSKHGGYYISLEPKDTEGFLPYSESLPDEVLSPGDSVKIYLKEVLQNTKKGESQLIFTRSNPAIVQELLKLNIPEIADGTFVIKAVARKPGEVTKIILHSLVDNIDPISVTVGKAGARIKPIRQELGSERIEIIRYTPNIKELITNAIHTSRVLKNRIAEVFNIDLNYDTNEAFIVVADEFLAPLIGRQGSHQRMLEEILGWKIRFNSYSDFKEVLKEKQKEVDDILGISDTQDFEIIEDEMISLDMLPFSPEQIQALEDAGFRSVTEIVELTVEDLTAETGLSLSEALEIWKIIEDNIEIEENEE